jgi:hypothetical protein
MIPRKAARQTAELAVMGGTSVFSEDEFPRSMAQARRFVKNHVRNDQIQVQLYAFGRRGEIRRVDESTPQEKVVDGERFLRVRIR